MKLAAISKNQLMLFSLIILAAGLTMIFTAEADFWDQMLERPLELRLAPAPAVLLDFVNQCNAAAHNTAVASSCSMPDDFLLDLQRAITELPASIKAKLEPCLLGVYFMQGVGSSAVTDVIALANGELLGAFVALDPQVFLARTANQWATWKENFPFQASPELRLEARIADENSNTRQAALQFLLLHEFGHVLTASRELMPDWWLDTLQIQPQDHYTYLPLSWEINPQHQILPQARCDFPLRDQLSYYAEPQIMAHEMLATYQAVAKTNFPTLYAATNVYDDFAESFAGYVHTVLMQQPYEICIFKADELIFSLSDFWYSPRSQQKRKFFADFLAEEIAPRQTRRKVDTATAKQLVTALSAVSSNVDNDIEPEQTTPFLGLAPFLRANIAGIDLRPIGQAMLAQANLEPDNANLWMNLATAFFSIKLNESGLAIQQQALQLQRLYALPAQQQPARCCVLVLMAEGDIAENTPIDCLLEQSNIDLLYYYATTAAPLPEPLPAHDALMVGLSDSMPNREILQALDVLLQDWPVPVINQPRAIPNTERSRASQLMQDAPGILMPLTWQIYREELMGLADEACCLADIFAEPAFPMIVRPVGSQAGRDLAKLSSKADILHYLNDVHDDDFFLSRFIDYRSADGQFRKYRIAFIDGQPFAAHMGISSHWMIHYLNAGMYEEAAKREEEAQFMANFADFSQRHAAALQAIHQQMGLDYVCIDCAETLDGELLIFEIDHVMVVHAMDPEDLFPYKQIHMQKIKTAFESYLYRLTGSIPQAQIHE